MTATLQRYCRQLPGEKKLVKMALPECLHRLGLQAKKKTVGGVYCFNIRNMNEWELADLFKAAHALYLKMIAELHPDKGGSTKLCARLTELWMRIKQLFKRKGVAG